MEEDIETVEIIHKRQKSVISCNGGCEHHITGKIMYTNRIDEILRINEIRRARLFSPSRYHKRY